MFDLLKIIHLLSFAAGVAGGLGSMVVGMRAAGFPGDAMAQVGGLRMAFGRVATVALILLWITGVWLMAVKGDATVWRDTFFILKMVAVVALTGVSVYANLVVMRAARAKTPPDAGLMNQIGRLSGILSILALIFAVMTFH